MHINRNCPKVYSFSITKHCKPNCYISRYYDGYGIYYSLNDMLRDINKTHNENINNKEIIMNEKKDIDIIQWLGSNLGNTKIVYEVFGKLDCSLGGLTKDYTTQEIIDRITQYERNKERKPKFDRRFRYRIYDTNYLIVKSGIINNVKNHQQAWTKARLILDEYLVKHPYGEYAVDVEKFSTFNKEYEES